MISKSAPSLKALKFVALAILLLIAILLLSGCERNDNNTLRVAINSGDEGNAVRELSESFPDAEVVIVELPYSELREQLGASLRSGNSSFDVVMLDDPWFPELADNLSPLKSIDTKYNADFIVASVNLGREPYARGILKAAPIVGNTQLLFYRRDLLDSVGLTQPPRTWSEVADLAETISTNTNSYGYAIRGRAGPPIVTDFLPIYWSLGGKLFDDRSAPKQAEIDTAKMTEALTLYKRLADASPPGALNFDWTEMTAAFTSGKAAMELNWPAAVATVNESIDNNTPQSIWGVALAPGTIGNDGKASAGTSMIGNWLLAIPSNSTDKAKAELFIDFVLANQEQTVSAGTPPTLKSTYRKISANPASSNLFHLPTVKDALELSTVRARTEKWAEIERHVSDTVTSFLVEPDQDALVLIDKLATNINSALE